MATATMGVSERTRELTVELSEKRQAHDDAERKVKALVSIWEADDPEAYHRAALELPTARLRVHELAADALLVEVELKDAREKAREAIRRERTPGREKLIDAMHRTLIAARDARRNVVAFDLDTEQLLDGQAPLVVGFAALEDLDGWRNALR